MTELRKAIYSQSQTHARGRLSLRRTDLLVLQREFLDAVEDDLVALHAGTPEKLHRRVCDGVGRGHGLDRRRRQKRLHHIIPRACATTIKQT